MIAQSTLEAFLAEDLFQSNESGVLVLIAKDINVAWTDRNWYLHSQDIVYLDEKLASVLIMRGTARKLEVDGHASA